MSRSWDLLPGMGTVLNPPFSSTTIVFFSVCITRHAGSGRGSKWRAQAGVSGYDASQVSGDVMS